MTIQELSEKSDEELRVMCARAHHGWEDFDWLYWCDEEVGPLWEGRRLHGATPTESRWHQVPDYPTDLNAMHEAENAHIYDDGPESDKAFDYLANLVVVADAGRSQSATARQRCIAFIAAKQSS